MTDSFGRVSEALQFIGPTDRETWYRMGMSVKSELNDAGFDIWNEWSRGADSYNQTTAKGVWKSIRPVGGITIGTLFHEAKANGWRDDGKYQRPTLEEIAERNRIVDKRAAKEAKAIEDEKANAAKLARELWVKAKPVPSDNPYLARKGVNPVVTLREIDAAGASAIIGYAPQSSGQNLTGRLLVVPVKQDGKQGLSTLELIDGAGRKTALAGRGSKTGGFWAAQRLPDGTGGGITLLIGEGVATGLSAHEATGYMAIAALSSGNLGKVASLMRERYPDARLVVLADLVKATGDPDEHAIKAAESSGAALALPDFGANRPEGETDFNDMAVRQGPEAVKRCIDEAINGAATQGDSMTYSYGGGCFEVSPRGVFFTGTDKDGNELPPRWICSPLSVMAKTRDAKSSEWGRLLEWQDDDHMRHQWAMPSELLQGDGADMRRELARRGLSIAPSKAAHDLLTSFLQVWPVDERARCVERLGWHGAVYVTPAESIGQDGEIVVFQNAHALEPSFSVSGTAEEWRASVAALAAGNSRLVFVLSAAFAGALADVVGEDSGGFHLRGGSSSGKSTALKVAASVWGDPSAYPRLWRATANGLEGLAALHNDGLLILDELSQIDPKEAGEAAYLLANGQGKSRASRTGTARQSARWRLLFLSAGEESLSALMARAGKRTNAGQEIRLADIESDAGAGMGAFEALHDQPTPAALALAVKDAAIRCHGAVGVEWLHRIVADRAKLADFIEDGIRQFVQEVTTTDAAGQVLRVARRFALVAVAGELATHYGLTGWLEDEAINAARKCFAAWLEGFGGTGNREERAMLSQVRAFFETHGASRFEDMNANSDQRIPNRAGFYRTTPNGTREFLVLPEAFRMDVCQGFDLKAATAALAKAGWLEKNGDRNTQVIRLSGLATTRCYVFNGRMWEDGQ